jgi:hypothetical protein
MSALGQKQTLKRFQLDFRFIPKSNREFAATPSPFQ